MKVYPYSFEIMIKEISKVTIFHTTDHYKRRDESVVFEGRMVFGGHIPVEYFQNQPKVLETRNLAGRCFR